MSLRTRHDFLRIWTGQVVSTLGDGVHRIAVLWWAKQSTGSNIVLVAVALATTLPGIVGGPACGWLVDRFDRRRLMVAADGVRLAASAALAGAATSGRLTPWFVVTMSVLAAFAAAVFRPAYFASITRLVADDELPAANSLVGVCEATAGVAGPALGGLLLGMLGTASALWIDAATFAVSAALIAMSHIPPLLAAERAQTGTGLWVGFALLRRRRALRDLTLVATSLNTLVAPAGLLLVSLAAGPFRLGSAGFGLLDACLPAGMLVGFALAARASRSRSAAVTALLGAGCCLGAVGATTVAAVGGVTLLAAGVCVSIANTVVQTRFQRAVEPAEQGRVFGLVSALADAGRPVGLVLAAPLLVVAGPRWGLAACGLGMVTATLVGRRGLTDDGDTLRAISLSGHILAGSSATVER